MEASKTNLKLDILEFLQKYPDLRLQYLFLNCFVISSKETMINYFIAKSEHKTRLNGIEIYYSPEYLYTLEKDAPIFDRINAQKTKKYYYLKEHIFYYQYLLKCLKIKKSKEKNETDNKRGREYTDKANSLNINEIAYRTLMNRLYLLYDGITSNSNYGINKVFGVPCIYSVIEPNVLEQIITMKKFSFNLMNMESNKFSKLFGINDDIDKQSYLYNNLLISISESNSSLNEINNGQNDDININKINRGSIEIEKNLIDLSNELFLFNYITKQFDKNKLIQLPRILFFVCLFDDEFRNIYEIEEKKEKIKKRVEGGVVEEETNNKGIMIQNKSDLNEIIKKGIKENKKEKNKKKENIKTDLGYIKVKRSEKLKSINKNEKNLIKEEIDEDIDLERVDNQKEDIITEKYGDNINKKNNEKKETNSETPIIKHLLKCELMSFCGTLELDGAFRYIGNMLEIKGDSLVIILAEFLNDKNNNIKEITQKFEAIDLISKIRKHEKKELRKLIQKYDSIKNDIPEGDKENIMKRLKDLSEKKIMTDKRIIINNNDIVLIENKREYPHHISNEIRNFIEHSFYFINLYKNLNLIKNNNIIHLIFVYDHYRHYNDESEAFIGLFKVIDDNKIKINSFSNKIKFYLVHSLPNLNLSIFDRLQNDISDLKEKNEKLSSIVNKNFEDIERYLSKINELEEQIKNLNNIISEFSKK